MDISFREGNPKLIDLLNRACVMCHPFIIGELACGNLKNRGEILSLLKALPMVIQVKDEEVLEFIERRKLMGRGLGYIDVHLLASAILTGVLIWTFDRRLKKVAKEMGLDFSEK